MKILFSFLVVLAVLLSGCSENKKKSIDNLSAALQKHQSVHYKLTQKYYYSNQPDTTQTNFEIWVVRNKNKYVWVDDFYRPYHLIAKAEKLYLTIPPKKVTLLYKNFNEDLIAPVDWIDVFLSPDTFIKKLKDKNNLVEISDTLVQSKKLHKIYIQFPKNAKGEQQTHIYLLNEDMFPESATLYIKTPEYFYTNKLLFSNYIYDRVDKQKLQARQKKILAENPIEETSDADAARLEGMLHVGEHAPLFEGKIYASGEKFKLENYIGKNVIVVDFWYTHCPPCVRAIPELIELQKKYANKGLKVFGLNSVDNQSRSMKNLQNFLDKRTLSYDVILTQPEVDMMYKIKGYPSLYVVDKSGKIAYVEIGYNKEKFKHLREKVAELLK